MSTTIASFLYDISPFSYINKKDLTQVASQIDIIYLMSGEKLPQTPPSQEYLYVIYQGSIEQRRPDGSLRAKLGAEDLFGYSLLDKTKPHYEVKAIEESLIYRIPYDKLLQQISHDPKVISHFARQAKIRMKTDAKINLPAEEKSLFLKKISEVSIQEIVTTPDNTSIQDVARLMKNTLSTSCAAILQQGQLAGLVTDHDLTKKVIAKGLSLQTPIKDVMVPIPQVIYLTDTVLKATSTMMTYNLQNLPVLNESHQVVGLLTPIALLEQHSLQAIFIIDEIRQCINSAQLIKLSQKKQAIFEALVKSSFPPQIIGQLLTLIYDAFHRRLIELALEHFGEAPCDFAWFVAGSHARQEVHMDSDQDNGLILSDKATPTDRVYFNHLAMWVCKALDECGYHLCTGHYMAANHQWCQSLKVWQNYIKKWTNNPEYELLLDLNVFLDCRFLYGDASLFHTYEKDLSAAVLKQPKLIHHLTQELLHTQPALSIFNQLVLMNNGQNQKVLNIKKAAIQPLIDRARIYALEEGIWKCSTVERYEALQFKDEHISAKDYLSAYHAANQFRYQHQYLQLTQGQKLDNLILAKELSSFERYHLKDIFKVIRDMLSLLKIKSG